MLSGDTSRASSRGSSRAPFMAAQQAQHHDQDSDDDSRPGSANAFVDHDKIFKDMADHHNGAGLDWDGPVDVPYEQDHTLEMQNLISNSHRERPYIKHIEKDLTIPLSLVQAKMRHDHDRIKLKFGEDAADVLLQDFDLINRQKETCCGKFIFWIRDVLGIGHQREVSFFWAEKLGLLLYFLQVFALIRCVSDSWPWPTWWSSYTKWTVLFNLDFAFFLASSGNFNYVPYVIIWLSVPPCIVTYFFFMTKVIFKENLPNARKVERITLVICESLYMPYTLAVFRIVACSTSSFSAIDSVLGSNCWQLQHLILLAFVVICSGLFLIAIPTYLAKLILHQAVYKSTDDHELYVRGKEAEFLLNLDSFWETQRFFLFASFKRRWILYAMYTLAFKVLLVILILATTAIPATQALILFCLLGVSQLLQLIKLPFRDNLSNSMCHLLGWCNCINCLFGWLATLGIKSSFFVDSVQTFWLMALNFSALFFYFAIVGFAKCFNKQWVVTPALVAKEMRSFRHHVHYIIVCRELTRTTRMGLPEFIRLDVLSKHIDIMNNVWVESKRENLSLQKTIEDVLEDLVDTYNKVRPFSLLTKNSRPLELALRGLRERLDQRRIDFMLIGEARRVILMRMLALRVLVGDRKIRKDHMAIRELREVNADYEDRDSWAYSGSAPSDGSFSELASSREDNDVGDLNDVASGSDSDDEDIAGNSRRGGRHGGSLRIPGPDGEMGSDDDDDGTGTSLRPPRHRRRSRGEGSRGHTGRHTSGSQSSRPMTSGTNPFPERPTTGTMSDHPGMPSRPTTAGDL
eukprot:gnl/Hemi2/22816_TR7644_c0_g1_i1.p1 gnl/Hemi2/22816_TR7644_c0_g1~~gnl/Hemi2/22816_TR7644_c0_g1_i1.p1  ORF type:complete len:802 (+),score=250.25 gnl/Hemi2/22816_TR7644_c0_g1_i1:154-2559(+)